MAITAPAYASEQGVHDIVMDAHQCAAALFVVQSACVTALADGHLPQPQAMPTPRVDDAVASLLDVSAMVAEADPLAGMAIIDLRLFFSRENLRRQRIRIDDAAIIRSIDALHLATTRRNTPAFDTLLRRAHNHLTRSLTQT